MNILVAVPVFNEERYVARVLAEICAYADHVLVVDDGSTDATAAILRPMARRGEIALLAHPENRGYGQSLIDAFAYGHRHGFDWVITMDCDEQHEPARLPAFFEACRRHHEGGADVISGSRYLVPVAGADQPPADRRSINHTITELLNSTLELRMLRPMGGEEARSEKLEVRRDKESLLDMPSGAPAPLGMAPELGMAADAFIEPPYGLTDAFCGYKAHRVAAMNQLSLTIPGYAFPIQFWVQAAFAGLGISELPVRLIYKDATRHFGGALDDPSSRLRHYLEVLSAELAAARSRHPARLPECSLCCDD